MLATVSSLNMPSFLLCAYTMPNCATFPLWEHRNLLLMTGVSVICYMSLLSLSLEHPLPCMSFLSQPLKVELVDGMLLTEELPVTPDLSVGKVVEICTHFLELTDPRSDCMGIFVYDIPPEDGSPDPDADKPYADLER